MHASRLVQTCDIKCAWRLHQQLVQAALATVQDVPFDMLVLTRPCLCVSDVPAGSAVTSQPGSAGTVTFVNGKCTVSVSPCLTVLLFLHYCQHVPLLTKLCLRNICLLSQLQPWLAKHLTIMQHMNQTVFANAISGGVILYCMKLYFLRAYSLCSHTQCPQKLQMTNNLESALAGGIFCLAG